MQNPKDFMTSTYNKYLGTSHSNKFGNSSFWMDDLVTAREYKGASFNILNLSRYQRAISNFVKIITGKEIPVTFCKKGNSYTDGKVISIAGNIDDTSFDATAGLALHESSHIVYSDMEWFKEVWDSSYKADAIESLCKELNIWNEVPYLKLLGNAGVTRELDMKTIITFANWVEDRRIDTIIFRSSPGYKSYYHKLYDLYFFNPIISKMLLSSNFRDEDVTSYEARIVNLMNPNTDLSALKKLREIASVIDLPNISRLTSIKDSMIVALRIADLIASELLTADSFTEPQQSPKPSGQGETPPPTDDNETDESNSDEDKSTPSANSPEDSDIKDTEDADGSDDGSSASGIESEDVAPDMSTQPGNGELSPGELKKAINILQNIQELISGEVHKSGLKKEEANVLNEIAQSPDLNVGSIKFNGKNINVLHLRLSPAELTNKGSLTEKLTSPHFFYSSNGDKLAEVAKAGIQLGTTLGKKLKSRDTIRDTKFSRLQSGKIDRRLLHQCGYDIGNIFQQIHNDKFIPAVVDISIDASSSMDGANWYNTQTMALAVAKACSMIQNVQVKISYRYDIEVTSRNEALFVDVYDSKRDSIAHLINVVKVLRPTNTTVDSIITAYQLQNKLITPSGPDIQSYFINLSDGGPGATVSGISYVGPAAHAHIKKCREQIEQLGVTVMSYFMSETTSARTLEQFTRDWGKRNAQFIPVTEVIPLAKSLNTMFLTK